LWYFALQNDLKQSPQATHELGAGKYQLVKKDLLKG